MLFIRKDSILYLYQLGFDTKKTAFLITIRKPVFNEMLTSFIPRYVEMEKCDEIFGVNSFKLTKKKFGLLSCGDIIHNDKNKITISFRLRRDQSPNQRQSVALITTLSIIFDITQYLLESSILAPSESCNEQQAFASLTHNKNSNGSSFYAFSISADLSINFTRWIRNSATYEDKVNECIATNCLQAFKALSGRKGIINSLMGLTMQGFLFSSLHGVYSSQFGVLHEEVLNYKEEHAFGYDTFCHNTDTPLDQLVHLTGFATLLQCAREMKFF